MQMSTIAYEKTRLIHNLRPLYHQDTIQTLKQSVMLLLLPFRERVHYLKHARCNTIVVYTQS